MKKPRPPASAFATTTALIVLSVSVAVQTSALAQTRPDTTCTVVRGSVAAVCDGDVCTRGLFAGDLHGKFTTRVTSIYPSGSGWIYTAWTRIELDDKQGRIETLNYAMTPFDEKGGPDLAHSTEILSLSESSGVYEDYSGTIVLSGGHAAGQSVPYVGRLCRPSVH